MANGGECFTWTFHEHVDLIECSQQSTDWVQFGPWMNMAVKSIFWATVFILVSRDPHLFLVTAFPQIFAAVSSFHFSHAWSYVAPVRECSARHGSLMDTCEYWKSFVCTFMTVLYFQSEHHFHLPGFASWVLFLLMSLLRDFFLPFGITATDGSIRWVEGELQTSVPGSWAERFAIWRSQGPEHRVIQQSGICRLWSAWTDWRW